MKRSVALAREPEQPARRLRAVPQMEAARPRQPPEHKATVSADEFRAALKNAEFFLEYQPIFDLVTKEPKGLEALIRWRHPARGTLMPDAFIATAEETGLICEIGGWILREACTQLRVWQLRYPLLWLRLSVNISACQLADRLFLPQLADVLETTEIDPHSLQLEVTETQLIDHQEPVAQVIDAARALGVRFALDDFGTGYSSLRYLDRYAVDAIKIDQSFVAGLPDRRRSAVIVKAIVDLGQQLELEITAEGIEETRQMESLRTIGCENAQGYLLSRPLSTRVVDRLLRWAVQRQRRIAPPPLA